MRFRGIVESEGDVFFVKIPDHVVKELNLKSGDKVEVSIEPILEA